MWDGHMRRQNWRRCRNVESHALLPRGAEAHRVPSELNMFAPSRENKLRRRETKQRKSCQTLLATAVDPVFFAKSALQQTSRVADARGRGMSAEEPHRPRASASYTTRTVSHRRRLGIGSGAPLIALMWAGKKGQKHFRRSCFMHLMNYLRRRTLAGIFVERNYFVSGGDIATFSMRVH